MKKILAGILVLCMLLTFAGCGEEKTEGFKMPDVFGVFYTDATELLENEGFEVKAIETGVDSIAEKLLYPLEKVEKGTVFKVDDYIIDNNGNLTKNYDVFYKGEFVSEDKSVVIYYAKEDYIRPENIDTTKPDSTSSSDATSSETDISSDITSSDTEDDDGSIGKDFKAAMDGYEDFMDDYVAFMKKYQKNPGDLSLLADYTDFLTKYTQWVEDFEKWEDEDLNTAELAYYTDVQARVTKKLLEVAQ
ncbi:MAG: DUF6591 domain-containing protein [Acutalibacteraceae bacterium]|nr:DUF6591 domain-containing protein [Acutalibacteraceae bacterium]